MVCFLEIGKIIQIVFMVFLAGLAVLSGGCQSREPIKIGFVGALTGRLSDLGIAGRNGAMLAVEEVNRNGGLNGRRVELITGDDKQDKSEALKVDRELIQAGVAAIIGHMTSAMTIAALPLINQAKVVMVSPTSTTNQLNGLDDNLIRILPPNISETDHLAKYARRHMGLINMAVLYDLSNRAYSEDFFDNFKSEFERLGGRIILSMAFVSGQDVDFSCETEMLQQKVPDGVLVVAGALDAAMICQGLRRFGLKIPIISSGWAMTSDFVHHGGPAVEGVIFSHVFARQSQKKPYLDFKKEYSNRFGQPPNFAAAHSYEAAQMLFKALSIDDNPANLKDTIINTRDFYGVQGDFSLDRYGDPRRPRLLVTVKGDQFWNSDSP